ncbi:MAG: phosphatase PAP2 family protein [Alphaproteobacteria bacterium]
MAKSLWLAVLFSLAALTAIRPETDLLVSRWFYTPGNAPDERFPLRFWGVTDMIHTLAVNMWMPMAAILAGGLLWAVRRKKSPRAWLFLLLVLLIGPGLVANAVLKDHWGRARPAQVQEFGGGAIFTPYWQIADQCRDNCSFIAGDGAFGFVLPALGLVLARRRTWFWSGITAGIIMGGNRIVMGSHFMSDVVLAALLMLLTMLLLHAAIYGPRATRAGMAGNLAYFTSSLPQPSNRQSASPGTIRRRVSGRYPGRLRCRSDRR